MRELVYRNFAVSVWLLLGYCVVLLVVMASQAPEIEERFGPFTTRVVLWPVAYLIIESLLWVRVFRARRHGARLMAGVIGVVFFLQTVFVPLIVADVYGREPNGLRIGLMLYIAVSHVGFALFGREQR